MGVGPLLEVFICSKNSLEVKTLPEWGEGSRVSHCVESPGSTGVLKGAAPWPVRGSSKHSF